jgi:tripartite-type tricarboxylate transporter receptor subunit TctC
MKLNTVCRLLGALVGALTVSSAALAQSEAGFYKGKNIELVIASGPGGFDFVGRLVARHLGRHLPGQPIIVPQNMPGAGGLKAANFLFRNAKQDGTVLGQLPANVIIEDVLQAPGVAYKAAQFNEIGRVASGINLTIARKGSTAKTLKDAESAQVVHATTAPASLVQVLPTVANNLVGTKFKFVSGYTDTATTILAVERGEADAATIGLNSMYALRPGWLKGDDVHFLVQYTPTRSPRLPNVPAITEFVKSPADREVLDLFLTAVTMGQHITAPPNVPAERVAVLRKAFDDMLKDPAFLKEIEASNTWFDPMSGADLQKLNAVTYSQAAIARAKSIRLGS